MTRNPHTQPTVRAQPGAQPPLDWSAAKLDAFVAALCSWFDEHRRDLPWRRTRDPYAIWISEAMLQQTRVETVLDYHPRFLASLPHVRALAEAPEEQVLSLWSGLGYYRRARSLQAAARQIMERHGGRFPREHADFLALPGVGPYTAGAVLSIAFQAGEALVDGNVARVFSRLFGLRGELASGATQRQLWSIARQLVPDSLAQDAGAELPRVCPGNWNQALMELGALVCTPKKPDCAACPLRTECVAEREGLTELLPLRTAKARVLDVRIEVLLIRRGRRLLLVQRPKGGRMEGLWELPTRELGEAPGSHGLWPASFGLGAHVAALELGAELGRVSHAITKHRIKGVLLEGRLGEGAGEPLGEGLRWVDALALEELGLTGLTKKCLRLEAQD